MKYIISLLLLVSLFCFGSPINLAPPKQKVKQVVTKGAFKPFLSFKNPNNIALGQIYTNISFIAPYDGLLEISFQSPKFEANITWFANTYYSNDVVSIPIDKNEAMMFYRYIEHKHGWQR